MKDNLTRDVDQGRKSAVRELAEGIHVMTDYDLVDFIKPASGPVVSIYLPIHRTQREGRRDEWDRIEFKDLAKKAQEELLARYDEHEVKALLERMQYILDHEDLPLWIDASAGLAFLMNDTDTYVINMNFAHEPLVVVDDKFCIKPLIYNLRFAMHYKLLLLSTDFFSVLDGNYNGVHFEVLPADVKEYFAQEFADYDGENTPLDYYSLEGHMSPFHNYRSRHDVTKEEAEKFFRYVAKELSDKVLRNDTTPLILVTLPEHEHMFREIAHLRHLLPQAILKDPANMTGAELRDAAVAIMQGIEEQEAQELREEYNKELSCDKASSDWDDIQDALDEKRISVLLVRADGKQENELDDVISTVEGTLLEGGSIAVLSENEMPTDTRAAAIYRYAA